MTTDPGALENVLLVGGSLIGSFHGLFFQVRRGVLTEEDMNRIHAAGVRQRTRSPRDAPFGMILLTEPTALIPDENVRTRQRVIVNDLLKDPRTRMAVVIAGETMGATLLRSSSRGVVRSHRHLHLCDDAAEACRWLAQELELPLEPLQSALLEARARAERELQTS